MKWYNYNEFWIDIEKVFVISVEDKRIMFRTDSTDSKVGYKLKTNEERDAEFAKIKVLMGVSIAQDWTPGRCC